jgi:hypothetical protein
MANQVADAFGSPKTGFKLRAKGSQIENGLVVKQDRILEHIETSPDGRPFPTFIGTQRQQTIALRPAAAEV